MKKLLGTLLAALVILSALSITAYGFDGDGFTITPCEPFTNYSTDNAGQYMWQNPETGSNVLVKVGKQGTNIGTLSDAQAEVFRDTLISGYKDAFKEQLKSEPAITCRSMEKIDFKGHKALYLVVDMSLTYNGTAVDETQYVWVFTTKERTFFLYVTDNTGTESEKGFDMIDSFTTPDEALGENEKVGLPGPYKTVVGVVAGAAAGGVICLFIVKKKKKKEGYVQSTFSTTPTPVMPTNGEEANNDSKEGDTPAPSAEHETKETTEAEKTPEENGNNIE